LPLPDGGIGIACKIFHEVTSMGRG